MNALTDCLWYLVPGISKDLFYLAQVTIAKFHLLTLLHIQSATFICYCMIRGGTQPIFMARTSVIIMACAIGLNSGIQYTLSKWEVDQGMDCN